MSDPRKTCIGGGTGQVPFSQALKDLYDVTFIVNVADNGGSSGRLRKLLGVVSPGDIRRVLKVMASDDGNMRLLANLLNHRFKSDGDLCGLSMSRILRSAGKENGYSDGEISRLLSYTKNHADMDWRFDVEDENESLYGHTLGNLILAYFMKECPGSWVEKVSETLGTNGKVLPNILIPCELRAYYNDREYFTEYELDDDEDPFAPRIVRTELVSLSDEELTPYGEAEKSILALGPGDEIIVCPGSLRGSTYPSVYSLRRPIRKAVEKGLKLRIYGNVVHERRQTIGNGWSMNGYEMIKTIREWAGVPDYPVDVIIPDVSMLYEDPDWDSVLVNYRRMGASPVEYNLEEFEDSGINPIVADLVCMGEYEGRPVLRHDPGKIRRFYGYCD